MFDYRYHALSLAAVLLALALGVLLGVAIGDSNLVSSAKNGIVENLQSDLSAAHQHSATLAEEKRLDETVQNELYGIVVHDVLQTRKIGLVFLGSTSDQANSLVRETLTQSGGQLTMVAALRNPLDLHTISEAAAGTRYSELQSDPTLLKQFGFRMGVQLVDGGQLLNRVQTPLLSSFDGQFGGLQGLIVMRSNQEGQTSEQIKQNSEFQSGVIAGAVARGLPVVGVELTTTIHTQIPWYKSHDLTSVDDLDQIAGRAALVFALTGAHGTYGIKPTADGLLPRLDPLSSGP